MADIAEIQMKIKAVEFALGSFADYENEENFLRQNFSAIPGLKTYFVFSETELKDEEKQLQEMEILLLALQKRGRNIMLVFPIRIICTSCRFIQSIQILQGVCSHHQFKGLSCLESQDFCVG